MTEDMDLFAAHCRKMWIDLTRNQGIPVELASAIIRDMAALNLIHNMWPTCPPPITMPAMPYAKTQDQEPEL